jgi:hypothetical protein
MALFGKAPARSRATQILKVGKRWGKFQHDVVGESFNQKTIEAVRKSALIVHDQQMRADHGASIDFDDDPFLAVAARLVPEPTNTHDRNAVRVDLVDPRTRAQSPAGYLPREVAAESSPLLLALGREGLVVQCDAMITAGRPEERRKDWMFGIKLRFVFPDELAKMLADPSSRPMAIPFSSPVAHLPTPPECTPDEEGWFADPDGRHELRFWDGARWTEHVCDDYVQTADPLTVK